MSVQILLYYLFVIFHANEVVAVFTSYNVIFMTLIRMFILKGSLLAIVALALVLRRIIVKYIMDGRDKNQRFSMTQATTLPLAPQ